MLIAEGRKELQWKVQAEGPSISTHACSPVRPKPKDPLGHSLMSAAFVVYRAS